MELRLLLLTGLFFCAQAVHVLPGPDAFVGWEGDTYKPKDPEDLDEATQTAKDSKRPWVQVLSWRPRAFVYHHFLTDAEAAHILKIAAPQMKRSTVVGAGGKGTVDNIRTSAGMFIPRNRDPIIKAVAERLAIWTGMPPSHQEDLQVLRYGPTNKYGAHLDGLGRVASVLIYLVPPEEGGETAFPRSDAWLHPEMGEQTQGAFSECAKGHVAYKPKRGDALLFYDMQPDGKTTDPFSEHTGCPVVKGVKWNAVSWIHPTPFREDDYNKSLITPFVAPSDPGMCDNRNPLCETWAKSGECEKNPEYMLGGPNGSGMCRLACKDCVPCKANDVDCIKANREKGGFLNFDEAELKLAEFGLPMPTGSIFDGSSSSTTSTS